MRLAFSYTAADIAFAKRVVTINSQIFHAKIKSLNKLLFYLLACSKASGSGSQSGSDTTIISKSFSNAVHVNSLHSL